MTYNKPSCKVSHLNTYEVLRDNKYNSYKDKMEALLNQLNRKDANVREINNNIKKLMKEVAEDNSLMEKEIENQEIELSNLGDNINDMKDSNYLLDNNDISELDNRIAHKDMVLYNRENRVSNLSKSFTIYSGILIVLLILQSGILLL